MGSSGECVHMVWFRFKAETEAAKIDAAMEELRKLPALIPEITSLSCGTNFTTRTPHTHGLLVILKDKDGKCTSMPMSSILNSRLHLFISSN